MAHRLNNPLNYMATASASIKQGQQSLREEVLSLFKGTEDPESQALAAHYQIRFDEIQSPLIDLDKGLSLASQSVREIYEISGVSGIPLAILDVDGTFVKLLTNIRWSCPQEKSFEAIRSLQFYGNETILQKTFDRLAKDLRQTSHCQLELVSQTEGVNIFLRLTVEPSVLLEDDHLRHRSEELNYLLSPCQTWLTLTRGDRYIYVDWHLPVNLV